MSSSESEEGANAGESASYVMVSCFNTRAALHPASHERWSEPYVAAHSYGAGLKSSPKFCSCAGTSSHPG